mmetsp:Transcript_16125/g.34861  ORF Transcript_16125/g.34861 Transcript_16125/m.34861 type:complete len:265 (-) Transcript_16125:76-870(-)
MRSTAQQTCPALKSELATASLAALSRSASANTTMGSLPPSSRTNRFRFCAHFSMIRFPTALLPVIATIWTSSLDTNCSPTLPSPWTICRTPSGSAEASAETYSAPVRGVTSEGLTITVLPAASAGTARKGISPAGKFHGEMTTTTPSGSLTTTLSHSPLPNITSSFASLTMSNHAPFNPTASSTSDFASAEIFPISFVMVSANSWAIGSTAAIPLRSRAILSARGRSLHSSWAALAFEITSASSFGVVTATGGAISSPVAGLTF